MVADSHSRTVTTPSGCLTQDMGIRVISPAIGESRGELDLLGAVANLCIPPPGTNDTSRAYRMVALLLGGLRYGETPTVATD